MFTSPHSLQKLKRCLHMVLECWNWNWKIEFNRLKCVNAALHKLITDLYFRYLQILPIPFYLSNYFTQLLWRVYLGFTYELLLKIWIYTLFSIHLLYCFYFALLMDLKQCGYFLCLFNVFWLATDRLIYSQFTIHRLAVL